MSLDPFGDAPKWLPPDIPVMQGTATVRCHRQGPPDYCKWFFVGPNPRVAAEALAHHARHAHDSRPTLRDLARR